MHDAIRISPTPQAKPAGAARPYEPDLNPVSAPTSDPKDDRVDLRGPASSPISGAPGREAGPAPPPDSGFGIPDEPVTNTSGMRGAEIPEQLRKWNWAAFLVPDIWGVFNGVPWTLALLVLVIVPFIPFEMRFVLVVGARIFLGLRGNQLAWQGKKWRSEAHFQVVQRRWLTVSVILMGILLVLIFTSPESFTDGQQGQ
jgi:hypothetical protein